MKLTQFIAAAALLMPAFVAGDDGSRLAVDLVTMGRAVTVSVGVPNAFSQYRDVPQGLVFPSLRLDADRGLRFFRFDATNVPDDDQSVAVRFGHLGRWRFSAEFDEFPSVVTGRAAPVHNYFGKGRLVIPDGTQMQLESAADHDIPALATRLVSEVGRRSVGAQRERIRGQLSVQVTDNWSFRAGGREEQRNGQRPVSVGAFEALSGPGPAFSIVGFEVPAAVEIRTSEVFFGTSFERERFGVDAGFFYSRFRNSIADILYDNPFRFTDVAAVGGGALNPLGGSLGISADWPSTVMTSAVLSGFVNLTDALRLASDLMWTRTRQNEIFAPYTLNGQIVATGLPPGFGPVSKEILPRPSLGGRVTNVSVDQTLAWQLSPRAALRFEYRHLDTSDQTPEMTFPGYAGSGDTLWRTEFDDEPVTRPPLSLSKRGAVLELDWKPVKAIALRGEYGRNDNERGGRRGGATEEQTIGGRMIVRAQSGSSAVVSLERSERQADSTSKLLPFDLGGRQRSTFRARGEWIPRGQDTFNISVSLSDQSSRYESSVLRDFSMRNATLGMHWLIGDSSTITGEVTRAQVHGVQEWVELPAGTVWRRITDDGLTDFALSYEDSFRDDRFSVAVRTAGSVAAQRVRTRIAGGAASGNHDWPRVRNGLNDFAAGIEYVLSDRVRIGVQHVYETYAIEDFAWTRLSPYPYAALDDDTDARRLLFLDTHGDGYRAHHFGIYVRTAIR